MGKVDNRHSKKKKEYQQFIDALRNWYGLKPLYEGREDGEKIFSKKKVVHA